MLTLENVSKIYQNPFVKDDRILVLRGIDLKWENNDLIFISGSSGSGKSTFLKLISGIEPPTTGKIIFNEFQIDKMSRKERINFWRKYVGFLYQEPRKNLLSDFNVEQNIRLPMKILSELNQGQQKKRLNELLDFVGLQNYEKRNIDTLSGGEQQRIAVCVALANNPTLLLADEPTGELDSNNAHKIISLFQSLISTHETLAIVVTHNMSLINESNISYTMNKGLLYKKML